jgi:hypothetical protein
MCDAFLEDALRNLEKRTYESYQYGCQKFVDIYANFTFEHGAEPAPLLLDAIGARNRNANSNWTLCLNRELERQKRSYFGKRYAWTSSLS